MASKAKTNGQSKKMFNNFIDSIDVPNLAQLHGKGGRG